MVVTVRNSVCFFVFWLHFQSLLPCRLQLDVSFAHAWPLCTVSALGNEGEIGMTKDTPSPLDPKFPCQTISMQVHVNSLKSHRMYNSLRIGRCSHCVLPTCAHASTTTIDRHVQRLTHHDCLDTIHVRWMSPLLAPSHLWRITVSASEMEAEA